ncbi:WG repeat-containing protein [Halalkalibacter lacteus]|uniref:WG repeat-containing protein n=1 Tax=Halalkalibacter lacteus TaxID=3090663 RepID=UPI002FC67E7F
MIRKNLTIRVTRVPELFPAYVVTKDGKKWGYMNRNGSFILEPKFDEANDFQENGLAIVTVKGKAGMIDRVGQLVIQPIYSQVMPFTEGRAVVMDDSGFKVINERGQEITTKAYSFIQSYEEQRAIFSGTNSDGKYLYGYLDEQGNEVMPLQYENAFDFTGGKALVQLKENEFALIARNGEILQTYPFAIMMGYSEGLIPFKKTFNDKWGYVDEQGQIVLSPQYAIAMAFQEGRAVVNMSGDMYNQYGLINKLGKFFIPPTYNDIRQLGEQRVAAGIATNPDQPYVGSTYGIADTAGLIFTDFIYDHVGDYKEGLSSVTLDQSTFFIDQSGKPAKSFPVIPGVGTLDLEGMIIQAHVDHTLSYYDSSGKIVYQPNTSFLLNEQYRIQIEKFSPNKDYLAYYPQLEGMQNEEAQRRVNDILKQQSKVIHVPSHVQLDYSYYGDFSVAFFRGNLLVLKLVGYNYPFGAAHGMPFQTYVHIDLKTGTIYELNDLFKSGSDYVKVISDIIRKQIEEEEKQGSAFYFPDQYKGIQPDQPFYVTEDALAIYFQPYEIAAYAAGFPTFFIPYDEIMEMVDTGGTFWRSKE